MQLTLEEKCFAAHSAAGLLMGVVSGFMGKGQELVFAAICVLFGLRWVFWKANGLDAKKYNSGWWFGNGFWPYFTIWISVWVLVYNLVRV